MIIILVILSLFCTLLYSVETKVYAYINPVTGVATAMFLMHRKKAFGLILSTIFVVSFVFRLFLVPEESVLFSLAYNISLLVPYIAMMFVFSYLYKKFKIGDVTTAISDNKGYIIPYVMTVFITSFLGTILSFLVYQAYVGLEGDYFIRLTEIFFSHFFGMFLFNMIIHFALVKDFSVFHKSNATWFNLVFLGLFTTLTILIFRNTIPRFTIENFSFLFYFMFIMAGVLYSYRIILYANFIYLIVYGGYAIQNLTTIDYFSVLTHVSLFLLVANLSTVIIKMMMIIYLQKSETEIENTKTIAKLISTTNNYIGNIDSINSNPNEFFKSFIGDFFQIGAKLLPKFDRGSCYIVKDDKITFVDAIGFDVDILNGCDFDPSEFIWNEMKPTIINGYSNTDISARNPEYLATYKEKYSKIKQSLTFSLNYSGFRGAMSFDIVDSSDYLFGQDAVSSFNTFHKLVKSYMSMGSLYLQGSKLKTDIILSFVKTLGFYDEYTKNHSIDVANYTKELCEELELDSKTKELAYYASIVHDIGKIGISSDILNKKSRLTNEEYSIIKNHTVSGYNILSEIDDLKEMAVIVRHHHERWDGLGYPDQLKGNEIPFISQVIGVCDSVSAMLARRVYQSQKTYHEVIDELKACKGKQFSPVPCDAMIKILERKGLE